MNVRCIYLVTNIIGVVLLRTTLYSEAMKVWKSDKTATSLLIYERSNPNLLKEYK